MYSSVLSGKGWRFSDCSGKDLFPSNPKPLIYADYDIIKFKMKMPVFKSVPVEKVMEMENELYYTIRKQKGIWG